MMNLLKTYLSTLNIFNSSADITDEVNINHEHRSNIIASRIFFIVLFVVLIILIIVYRLNVRTTIVTLERPNINQFKNLSSNAHCPCSRISIPYREFISIETTIQCFYDQNCINATGTFTKLNITLLEMSRYKSNGTIEMILNNLMVEEYITNSSYDKYYNECSPSSCSYTYVKSHDRTEAALSLISLYGGLVIVTRCFAVIIVKIMYRTTRRISPQTNEHST